MPTGGPTLLGFDVIWIATILSFVATMAVLTAIYAATTAKDPMARRVCAPMGPLGASRCIDRTATTCSTQGSTSTMRLQRICWPRGWRRSGSVRAR